MLYTLLAFCFVSHLNNTPKPGSTQEPGLCFFWGGCLLVRQPLGLSDREISEHLHVVRQAVSKHRAGILRELREILQKEGFEWL